VYAVETSGRALARACVVGVSSRVAVRCPGARRSAAGSVAVSIQMWMRASMGPVCSGFNSVLKFPPRGRRHRGPPFGVRKSVGHNCL
jgi:hypothetical protein